MWFDASMKRDAKQPRSSEKTCRLYSMIYYPDGTTALFRLIPTLIDEPMLSEEKPINFGSFLYFAMRRWPKCRVHWQVDDPIDSPSMWLSDEAWRSFAKRFTSGPRCRRDWPKPDVVTVCTSPGFLSKALARKLVKQVHDFCEQARARLQHPRTRWHNAPKETLSQRSLSLR